MTTLTRVGVRKFFKSFLVNERTCEKGCDAFFVRLTPTVGFKMFIDDELCDLTYDRQCLAHRHGLAPRAWDKTVIKDASGCPLYGYFTEAIAATYKVDWAESHGYTDKSVDEAPWSVYQAGDRDLNALPAYQELCEALTKIDLDIEDLHWGNVGWHEGRMVAIDFSWGCS